MLLRCWAERFAGNEYGRPNLELLIIHHLIACSLIVVLFDNLNVGQFYHIHYNMSDDEDFPFVWFEETESDIALSASVFSMDPRGDLPTMVADRILKIDVGRNPDVLANGFDSSDVCFNKPANQYFLNWCIRRYETDDEEDPFSVFTTKSAKVAIDPLAERVFGGMKWGKHKFTIPSIDRSGKPVEIDPWSLVGHALCYIAARGIPSYEEEQYAPPVVRGPYVHGSNSDSVCEMLRRHPGYPRVRAAARFRQCTYLKRQSIGQGKVFQKGSAGNLTEKQMERKFVDDIISRAGNDPAKAWVIMHDDSIRALRDELERGGTWVVPYKQARHTARQDAMMHPALSPSSLYAKYVMDDIAAKVKRGELTQAEAKELRNTPGVFLRSPIVDLLVTTDAEGNKVYVPDAEKIQHDLRERERIDAPKQAKRLQAVRDALAEVPSAPIAPKHAPLFDEPVEEVSQPVVVVPVTRKVRFSADRQSIQRADIDEQENPAKHRKFKPDTEAVVVVPTRMPSESPPEARVEVMDAPNLPVPVPRESIKPKAKRAPSKKKSEGK